MATTYAELQSEIGTWLNRSDLATVIPTFIALAEADISRRLRTRDMEARYTGTVSSNPTDLSSTLTRPASLKSVSISYNGMDHVLSYISPDLVQAQYADVSSGIPQYYTTINDDLYLDPAPDSSYSIAIVYFQKIEALSDTNTSNWVLASHPDLYLVASQHQACIYLKRQQDVQGFLALQERILNQISRSDNNDRGGGSSRMISEVRAV